MKLFGDQKCCYDSHWPLTSRYFKCWCSCVDRSLQIVSFITWIELEKETRIVSVVMVVASLAALSARTLPGIGEWPEIHWMKMENEMELMELWIEKVWGFDEIRASHMELLSVQKSMEIEGWLVLVDVQNNADSMATGECSSFGFDGLGIHFRLDWGSSSDNCCCNSVSCPSTSGSISVDGVISLIWSNGGKAATAFSISVINLTSDTRYSCGNSSFVKGAKLPW